MKPIRPALLTAIVIAIFYFTSFAQAEPFDRDKTDAPPDYDNLDKYVHFSPPKAAGAIPDHMHLSWQHDTSTTMTVMWRTDWSYTGTFCQYGLTQGYGSQVEGDNFTYSGASGLQHTVEMTGLTPDTMYHFRCGDGTQWSSDYTFSTGPAVGDFCSPVKFAAMGDDRSSVSSGPSFMWQPTLAATVSHDPEFILHLADAVDDGEDQGGWDEFFEWAANEIIQQPMMHCWGNHENGTDSKFLQQFAFPVNDVTGTEDFYDWRYGPIHFFALTTEHGDTMYQQQAQWLAQKLEETDAIWKIVYFHRPAYSSGIAHGNTPEVQQYFVPVFDQYQVDVVLQAHDHDYERTKPIRYGEVKQNYREGTLYVTSGGAGAFLDPIGNPFTWWRLVFWGVYHATHFEVTFNTLTLKMIDWLGIQYDELTIVKDELGYPVAAFTANPNPVYEGETVTFDASNSYDPCGEIQSYSWDFGDSEVGSGKVVDHSYSEPNVYTATLTVADADDHEATNQIDIEVLPLPTTTTTSTSTTTTTTTSTVPTSSTTTTTVVTTTSTTTSTVPFDDDSADDDATDDDSANDDTSDDDFIDDDSSNDDSDDDDNMDDDTHAQPNSLLKNNHNEGGSCGC